MSDLIYLDHNATTPVLPEVVERMLPFLRDHFGNPSSGHALGKVAHDAVEQAREQVASLLGCVPSHVVFTSGGTESNNLSIRGVTAARPERRGVVTSGIEHPAVEQPCALLEGRGWTVTRLPVDGECRVDPAAALDAVTENTALVTVMLANNETGTLQPLPALARAAHGHGAVVHTDAAQAVGKVPTRVDELGVDLLTIAGHKLYAPKGIGALYVRPGTPLQPFMRGARHEGGMRPGTENVAYIAGLGEACAIAERTMAAESGRQAGLRDRLWAALRAGIPGVVRNGDPHHCLPNTLNFLLPAVRGSTVLEAAPLVAATTGSACHEGGERPSPVLSAMGVDADEALGAIRLSLGRSTTAGQVDRAATALIRAFDLCAGNP
jgi:cysteine desulfurase